MAVVNNFLLLFFLRLMWEFLDFESEREDFVCWPNNKIIDNWIGRQRVDHGLWHICFSHEEISLFSLLNRENKLSLENQMMELECDETESLKSYPSSSNMSSNSNISSK